MKHIVFLCLLLIFHVSVSAIEITIGTNQVTIPVPENYVLLTDDMQPLANIVKQAVNPDFERFAVFLPKPSAANGATNESLKHLFYVHTLKALIPFHLTLTRFEMLKQTIKDRNADALKALESEVPGTIERVNKNLDELSSLPFDLSVDKAFPLPPHYETERCLAHSILILSKEEGENGKPEITEETVTAAVVLVHGKALYLYAEGPKSDLERTRSESLKWIEAIIAANPSVEEDAPPETTRRRSGKTWENVAAQVLATVIIGIFVAAYKQRKRRLKG